MNFTAIQAAIRSRASLISKVMKLTTILLVIVLVQASAKSFSQKITLRENNAPLDKVINTIKQQSGYEFFYTDLSLKDKKITVRLTGMELEEALRAAFTLNDIDYKIVGKNIVLKKRETTILQRIAEALSPPLDVRGTVVDENGQPLAGVTVTIKGTNQRVPTDVDGKFYLAGVDDKATLVITFIGYTPKELSVKAQLGTIRLEVLQNELQEVNVAYGKTTLQANVSALTVIKGDQIQNLPNRSVDKSLQGLVPGLLVTSGTGQPGGGLSNFVLRGIATGGDGLQGSTVRNPLIVIDGVPVTQDNNQIATAIFGAPVINPMAQLNPSDIETLTVLKDAAAVALYGSKASNGVILITTKKGAAGKTKIAFRHQTDMSSILKGKNTFLSQDEFMGLLYETYKNTDPVAWTDAAILTDLKSKFPVKKDGSLYYEPNLDDKIFKNPASTVSNDLTFSGGNEKSLFYLNLEYTKQNGAVKNTGFDRKSIRFNFEHKPLEWFKLGVNSTMSYNIQDYASLTDGFPVKSSTFNSPLNPIRFEDGSYNLNFDYPERAPNPAASIEYNLKRNTSFRGLSKFYGEIAFLKYFKFTPALGIDFMLMEAKEKIDPRLYDDFSFSTGLGRIQERSTRTANLITTNTLRFDRELKSKHSISILLGQEAQTRNNKYLDAKGVKLQSSASDQINSTATREVYGNVDRETLESLFGQANYAYEKKYFFTASIRNDASSRFGERNRNGTYWSTGLGWVITEEPFMKKTSDVINYFKIRGSIGEAGNAFAIDKNARYDLLLSGNYLNEFAIIPYRPGNPDIKWEQTFTWDIGIESRLWDQRISLTADLYNRRTTDVVYTTNLPYTTGIASISDNIGDMENKGLELSLGIDLIRTKNFRWNLNGNWSTNKNVLIKANVPLVAVTGGTLGNEEGRNFNSFFMPVWAGVNAANGNPQWYDKDGNITSSYPTDIAAKRFVGKPQPDCFGAINNMVSYKGIDFSFQIYYQYGFQVYLPYLLANDGFLPYMNQDRSALNRWQKPGDMAVNPKRVLNNPDAAVVSSRFLADGSFWRLQNMSLAYNFPRELAMKMGLSGLKVYGQAYNLAVWYKANSADPSNVGIQGSQDLGTYPNQRTFSLGVNVNF